MKKLSRWKSAQESEIKWWKDHLKSMSDRPNVRPRQIINQVERELNVENDWNILDVGCGLLCKSRFFTRGKKYGIDPLINEYKKIHKLPENITFTKGIGENLPFNPDFFDFVISWNVLDHTKDPELVLKEVSRVLKDGGHCILGVAVYSSIITYVYRLAERLGFFIEVSHPHYFIVEKVNALLEKNNFVIINSQFNPKAPPKMENKLSYKKYIYFLFWSCIYFVNRYIFMKEWNAGVYVTIAKIKK